MTDKKNSNDIFLEERPDCLMGYWVAKPIMVRTHEGGYVLDRDLIPARLYGVFAVKRRKYFAIFEDTVGCGGQLVCLDQKGEYAHAPGIDGLLFDITDASEEKVIQRMYGMAKKQAMIWKGVDGAGLKDLVRSLRISKHGKVTKLKEKYE